MIPAGSLLMDSLSTSGIHSAAGTSQKQTSSTETLPTGARSTPALDQLVWWTESAVLTMMTPTPARRSVRTSVAEAAENLWSIKRSSVTVSSSSAVK